MVTLIHYIKVCVKAWTIISFKKFYSNSSTYFQLLTCYSIMVLDAGRIVEYAPPSDLLNNKSGVFYSMAKDAGVVA